MMILQTSRGALSSGGFDRMAARYIKAVETAGATVTSTQKDALNTFFKTGKSEGWISSLRRMYLPIWAAAAPNAIDMMTVTSGTFVGGVTHSSGFIKGDNSTGYFNIGTGQNACGISASSAYYFALAKAAPTSIVARAFLGSGGGSDAMTLRAETSSSLIARHYGTGTGQVTASSVTNNGIISFSRFDGNRTIFQRRSSSRSVIAGPTAGANSGNTTNANIFVCALNNTNTGGANSPSNFSNAEIGMAGFGSGVSDATDSSITSAIKTLWETSTGLTLP
jgi:hypothetical protein